MVHYSCQQRYTQKVLETANQLRENRQLCDIVLVVGNEKVHAHRNVLVAGSDYFRTLFLGPFNESSKAEIDLTSTTSDFPTFETCVQFLYTGEIDIDRGNLENLMKMSSCFLIPELQRFCSEFVKKNLKLSTALELYLYSMKYGYVKLESEIGAMVKSRFHDYYIFRDETLQISPDQLNHLFANDFLEFCSWDAMLKFLSDWISNGFTGQHLAVVKDILETVETEIVDTGNKLDLCEAKKQFFVAKDALGKIAIKLKSSKSLQGKHILRKCQQLLKSLVCQNATDIYTHGICKVKSRLHLRDNLVSQANNSDEDVLITISPKQNVIDAVNGLSESGSDCGEDKPWNTFVEPVLDVCSYNPRSREWYYLYSLNDKLAASTFIRSTGCYPWEYVCIRDRIFCVAQDETHRSPAYKLKLEDFSVEYASSANEEDSLPDGFITEQTRLLASTENVYSLSSDPESTLADFLRCRKFTPGDIFNANDPSQLSGSCFSLPMQEGMTYMFDQIASLSPYCNEMIIVVGYGRAEKVYVADLNSLDPNATEVHTFEIEDEYKSSEARMRVSLQIVVGKDRFYVLEVTKDTTFEQRRFKISCSFEYKYGSLSLTCKKASTLYVRDSLFAHGRRRVIPDPPLFYEHVFQHKGSVWIFSGNVRDTSALFEIFEESAGKLGVREHTPPPFPCILGAFSAQLSHSVLANKDRVIKYLLPK